LGPSGREMFGLMTLNPQLNCCRRPPPTRHRSFPVGGIAGHGFRRFGFRLPQRNDPLNGGVQPRLSFLLILVQSNKKTLFALRAKRVSYHRAYNDINHILFECAYASSYYPVWSSFSSSPKVAGAGFEPTASRLCLPTTVFTALTVCGLDFLFTLGFNR